MKLLPTLVACAFLLTALAGCADPETPPTSNGTQSPGTGTSGAPTSGPSGPVNPYAVPGSTTTVSGSGATFSKAILETWGLEFSYRNPSVQVSYAGGGSGKGISDITKKDVIFGASDAPLSPSEKAAAPGILQFPETLGLISIVYNVPGVSNGLKLTGEIIGKIYVGSINQWNDAAIADLNPGVTLPANTIVIVYRSDSSGTTYAFTDFLTKASPSWVSVMGSGPSKKPDWTKSSAQQLSGNGNDGVGSTTKSTQYAIGYVELAYMKSLGLKGAHIQNLNGEFVEPTVDGASKAAAAAVPNLPAPDGDWSQVSIAHANGTGVYPISTFSYILVYDSLSTYGSKATGDQLRAFRAWMWWCLHDGQAYGPDIGYAPIPADVAGIGDAALQRIQV